MVVVNIAKDFTRFPAGRYKRNSSTSGEAFREKNGTHTHVSIRTRPAML